MRNIFESKSSTLTLIALAVLCSAATSSAHEKSNAMETVGPMNQMVKIDTATVYPQRPEDISPLLIGEKVPEVTLLDVAGQNFNIAEEVKKKPTILIFYRGGWCPYCSKQLSGLQEISPSLEKLGYQILAVGTDQPEGLMQSVTKEKLSYTLLSDADLSLSKQFGIAFKAPKAYWEMLSETTNRRNTDLLLPVPSVFILDTAGKIQYEYINPDFKQRLNPTFLKTVATSIYKEL